MRRLLLILAAASLGLLAGRAHATCVVPFIFQNNVQLIDAVQVNANFAAVAGCVNTPTITITGAVQGTGPANAVVTTGPVNLGMTALTQSVPNSAIGTVTNELVIFDTGYTFRYATTGSTTNVVGICQSGCGNAGNATIAISGTAACAFDGATTAADFVVASTTAAGQCHDAGATVPAAVQVIGQVNSTNASGGIFGVNMGLVGVASGAASCVTCVTAASTLPDYGIVLGTTVARGVSGLSGLGTTTTVLHGNAVGPPSYGSVATGDIAAAAVTNVKLANASTTVNGQTCTLGSSCTVGVSPGSISLTNTHMLVGNVSNVAADVAASGDLTLANTGAFTIANSAVTNVKLANSATTVNGQTCALGSTCTVTAAASSLTVGTTTISGGTNGDLEFNNSGVLGEKTPTGTGNVVLATSPSISGLTVTSSFTATGLVTNADLVNSSLTIAGHSVSLGGSQALACSDLSSACMTLSGTSQAFSGGLHITAFSIGTVSSGTTTIDCGNGPLQYLTNGGAFTLAAPANDSDCIVETVNNGSAGTITFSGFSVGSNTGDALDTTNTHKFFINIARINGSTTYRVSALQ